MAENRIIENWDLYSVDHEFMDGFKAVQNKNQSWNSRHHRNETLYYLLNELLAANNLCTKIFLEKARLAFVLLTRPRSDLL